MAENPFFGPRREQEERARKEEGVRRIRQQHDQERFDRARKTAQKWDGCVKRILRQMMDAHQKRQWKLSCNGTSWSLIGGSYAEFVEVRILAYPNGDLKFEIQLRARGRHEFKVSEPYSAATDVVERIECDLSESELRDGLVMINRWIRPV